MIKNSNKNIVLEVYKYVIGQLDLSLIDTYVNDHYRQHSPSVKDGKAGLIEMLTFLKTIPRTGELKSPIIRIFEDESLVAAHLDVEFMGKRLAVLDLFKLENRKLVEHWDAVQEQPKNSFETITMTNGSTEILDKHLTTGNKSLINEIYEKVYLKNNLPKLKDYLADDFIDHRLETFGAKDITKLHRVIGEGNFVVTQAEGRLNGVPHVMYDIFRVENHKIAEHWAIEQAIPNNMPHSNGMI